MRCIAFSVSFSPLASRAAKALSIAVVSAAMAMLVLPGPAAAQDGRRCVLDTDGDGVADGAFGFATGSDANLACGRNADARGDNGANTAVGNEANASGDESGNTALGHEADASGSDADGDGIGSNNVALGSRTNASGHDSQNVAIGEQATSTGQGSGNIAAGALSSADGSNSGNAAFGGLADAQGSDANNTAIGSFSNASGSGAMDVDGDGVIDESRNTAVGAFSDARGDSTANVAVGGDGNGDGVGAFARNNSTAVGADSRAEHANSAAFGRGATTTRDNQQVFGTAANTYTMAGVNSDASRTAQAGTIDIVTTDAGGNLAGRSIADLGLATAADIGGLQSQINSLGERDDELAEGIAISLALAQPFIHAGQTFAINLGWGSFDGDNALGATAAGIVSRGAFGPSSTVTVHGGVGAGTSRGTVAGRAGVSFGW